MGTRRVRGNLKPPWKRRQTLHRACFACWLKSSVARMGATICNDHQFYQFSFPSLGSGLPWQQGLFLNHLPLSNFTQPFLRSLAEGSVSDFGKETVQQISPAVSGPTSLHFPSPPPSPTQGQVLHLHQPRAASAWGLPLTWSPVVSLFLFLFSLTGDHTGDIPGLPPVCGGHCWFFKNTSLLSFGNEASCVWLATH